jgi:two-component system sensor histidine kinase CreC
MKLGLRIFAIYLVIFLLCFSYPIGWVLDNMRTRYLEGVEDPLVDQANILAEIVGSQMAAGRFQVEAFRQYFQAAYDRKLETRIYHLTKDKVDLRVYLTDLRGRVLFDSLYPENVGADYSQWRDVLLTLQGRYGSRTTLSDPQDPKSSVLHVAAPVMVHGELAGVLAVAKPTTNINRFIRATKPKFLGVTAAAAAAAICLSYLAALWLARPIRRLTAYAEAIRAGRRATFPALDRTEIGDLGHALRKMHETLEGKDYVEQYVQKLTHEVKSPLSAIRGAAELLGEEMPPDNRKRFLANIRTEADRIQTIVDRMLELADLEFKKQLNHRRRINVAALVKTVLESKHPLLAAKQMTVAAEIPAHLEIQGDPFLLHQALANLVQNAIDFTPARGTITLRSEEADGAIALVVEDDGATIPDYALDKIFDKFFSLQRPDGGRKSTGLGLNLVKEVAQLHQGSIRLENIEPRGVRATLSLGR